MRDATIITVVSDELHYCQELCLRGKPAGDNEADDDVSEQRQ